MKVSWDDYSQYIDIQPTIYTWIQHDLSKYIDNPWRWGIAWILCVIVASLDPKGSGYQLGGG